MSTMFAFTDVVQAIAHTNVARDLATLLSLKPVPSLWIGASAKSVEFKQGCVACLQSLSAQSQISHTMRLVLAGLAPWVSTPMAHC